MGNSINLRRRVYKQLLLLLFLVFLCVRSFSQSNPCIGQVGTLDWLIFETNNSNVSQNHFYPQCPSRVVLVTRLETQRNYTDNFISVIKGFLKVPVEGRYYFNITGNAEAGFYISSNETIEDTSLLISASSTGYDEHANNPAQTDSLDLVPERFYYFELHLRETNGSDHARVCWKMPGDTTNWTTIGGQYLYQYACNTLCPPRDTPCDDGLATTVNDREDGACNCFGTPVDAPDCVGKNGQALALYYDGIAGTGISQLVSSPSYPLQPSRSEIFYEMRMPNRALNDSFGTLLNACLLVPVTGSYEFSTTGNTNSELYLGSSPAMDDLTLLGRSSGGSKVVQLNANQFYYLRLIHKENQNQEEFAALWKTPFHTPGEWKTIDGAYLYQYNCELACIPAGTPCDDKDPETINDSYDGNCHCTGTPCPNGDCPEAYVFHRYDACENTGAHGTHPDDSWLSCVKSANPNPVRGSSHWIQYDFGSVIQVGKTHVWNYNVAGNTGKGFRDVAVDISVDRDSWKEIGEYEWEQASGTNDYLGFEGPDLEGNSGRYLLITGLSTWNNENCAGFSEIQFSVDECPSEGTPCNDTNPETINDQYDSNCECKGTPIVSTGFDRLEEGIKVFPNPVAGWATIVFNLNVDSSVDLYITDITGRKITSLTSNLYFEKGFYQKAFSAHNLVAGNYLLVLKTSTGIFVEKITKIE